MTSNFLHRSEINVPTALNRILIWLAVTHSWFIPGNNPDKKISFIGIQQILHTHTHLTVLWSSGSCLGTYWEHSFWKLKLSCTMLQAKGLQAVAILSNIQNLMDKHYLWDPYCPSRLKLTHLLDLFSPSAKLSVPLQSKRDNLVSPLSITLSVL